MDRWLQGSVPPACARDPVSPPKHHNLTFLSSSLLPAGVERCHLQAEVVAVLEGPDWQGAAAAHSGRSLRCGEKVL